jgi:phage terminase large subunit
MAWEFVYNEESGVFSREPNHNWASHPSDGFAYGCQIMTQFVEKEPEKVAKFPVTGNNGRITTIALDDLWADTSKKAERY